MKLTNISLAILVALGLAACGGSDDNNDQTTDPKETTPIKKEEGPKETPKEDPKSGLIPERAAPDMTVPADIEGIVSTRKTAYVDRTFTDSALGYLSTSDFTYDETQGTDPANVKTTSFYNFASERDVVRPDVAKIADDVKDTDSLFYTQDSIGAIHVGKNPAAFDNNAFVKTPKGYVRVATKTIKGSDFKKAQADTTEQYYTPKTKFYAVKNNGGTLELDTAEEFDQSEVVFIANAKTGKTDPGLLGQPLQLGKEKIKTGPTSEAYQYDPTANEVSLTEVKVFDQTYKIGINGQNIDFGKLPRKAEIQTREVTGNYQVRNGKGTGTGNDNFVVNKKIKLGNIKAYNLPYAIAFVTTNVDEKNPDDKDLFGIGSYKVLGFKTIALPKEGRAKYTGKSFGPAVEGDIELIADFFADRAGVSGSILNRKDKDGNILPNLTLDEVSLTTPENHSTGGFGAVKGDPLYADTWSVNFYGQEAEEAAGAIGGGVRYASKQVLDSNNKPVLVPDTTKPTGILEVQEVFNSQRGKLTNKSNTPDTK